MNQSESKSCRKRTFEEAFTYNGLSLDLLHFYSSLLQIVQLEYLMGRNDAAGSQIMAMEDKVLAGIVYWKNDPFTSIENEDEELVKLKSAPEKVI